MMTMANNIVLHSWMLLREKILQEKMYNFIWWQRVTQPIVVIIFAVYTNIKSLCYTPETNKMFYVNYTSTFFKR